MDFLEQLDNPPLEGELEPAKGPLARETIEKFRLLEDEILSEATDIIQGAMSFHKIDPTAKEPPDEWVKSLGRERATERFRLAQYALMNAKEAPVGLKMATAVHGSIVKARSTEKAGARPLNVMLVQMPAANVKYPELEVGEEQ